MNQATLLTLTCTMLLLGCTGAVPATPSQASESPPDVEASIVWVKYEYETKLADGTVTKGGGSGSGVIVDTEDGLLVYTNRHVIDCGYAEDPCWQRISEKVTVRTQNGKLHPVSRVAIAPHNLDIAFLTVDTNGRTYRAARYVTEMSVGDRVIAVGYPAYAARVLEFSKANGRITALKDLLMDDGFAFASIATDAHTSFGLVEKTDRLYRNLKDHLALDDLGVSIHLVNEGTVISSESHSSARFLHGIKVLMARNYVENLSE